jgi:hypothetical protein
MGELQYSHSPEKLNKFSMRLVNLIALILKEEKFLQTRFVENFVYGHQEILLEYCGLELSTQIIGVIQHGAKLPITAENIQTPKYISGYRTKYWAWSKTTEELAKSKGLKHVKAIGAPWLYLRKGSNEQKYEKSLRKERVLIMPSHSTGNAVDMADSESKSFRAKLFREAIGNRTATVCLHPADYCDPTTRRAFEACDFKLTCIGSSNFDPPWSPVANRIASLKELLSLMNTHTHYVSDGYGTSMIYAIDLDMKIGVFPEIRHLQKLNANSTNKNFDYANGKYLEVGSKLVEDYFPRAINEFVQGSVYRDLADTVLGVDSILSPEELRDTLDYRLNIYRLSGNFQPW